MFTDFTQRRLCIAIGGFALLNACSPTCPPPKVVTQIVREPIAVACVDPASVKPEPAKVTLATDARIAADQAAAQAITLRAYIHELLAVIQSCTGSAR